MQMSIDYKDTLHYDIITFDVIPEMAGIPEFSAVQHQNASASGIDSMNAIPSSRDMLKTAVDSTSAIPESLQTIDTDLNPSDG